MSFMMFPPEVNSSLMYSGAGSGPLMAAASALGRVGRRSGDPPPRPYQTVIAPIDRHNVVRSILGANGCGGGAVCGVAGKQLPPKLRRPVLRPGLAAVYLRGRLCVHGATGR